MLFCQCYNVRDTQFENLDKKYHLFNILQFHNGTLFSLQASGYLCNSRYRLVFGIIIKSVLDRFVSRSNALLSAITTTFIFV